MKKIEINGFAIAFLTKKTPKTSKVPQIDRWSGVSGRLLW